MAKKDYLVNWELDHNKKTYKEGATVKLDDKEAEPLLGLGVISEMKQAKKKTAAKKPEPEPVKEPETGADAAPEAGDQE